MRFFMLLMCLSFMCAASNARCPITYSSFVPTATFICKETFERKEGGEGTRRGREKKGKRRGRRRERRRKGRRGRRRVRKRRRRRSWRRRRRRCRRRRRGYFCFGFPY